MDKLTHYRAVIKRVISEFVAPIYAKPRPNTGLETPCVFDDERGHYLVMSVGWQNDRRVHGVILHVRLRDGKFWIEDDMTEDGVATWLVQAGVPKEDIVLAFQPPDLRPLTEFAVA